MSLETRLSRCRGLEWLVYLFCFRPWRCDNCGARFWFLDLGTVARTLGALLLLLAIGVLVWWLWGDALGFSAW